MNGPLYPEFERVPGYPAGLFDLSQTISQSRSC